MIYVTKILCIITVYTPILFVETVSKSNFILILLYLRIHMFLYFWLLNILYFILSSA